MKLGSDRLPEILDCVGDGVEEEIKTHDLNFQKWKVCMFIGRATAVRRQELSPQAESAALHGGDLMTG